MSWPRVDGLRTMEIGNPGEQRERLNGYVLHGTKRATAGLLSDYADEGEQLEALGEQLVLVDSAVVRVGVVRVTELQIVPFSQVADDFAICEGEGFTGWADWAVAHRRFWERSGKVITDDSEVVCIRFDLLPDPVPDPVSDPLA